VFLLGTFNNFYGIAGTIVCLFIILSCAGLTFPNAAAVALSPFTKNAGSASALLGFIQIGFGGLISSGVGLLNIRGSLPTAIIMFASVFLAIIILFFSKIKDDGFIKMPAAGAH
jgi:DHA1 family bicyclomycin/chloramphenicol resistance-like MFS transporter